ncbi:MAG: hypothetical protein M0017_06125 [Desulfobacteraceae bacterium]|nr:hypothetical protein [Desulfobacteraceae bacterium]
MKKQHWLAIGAAAVIGLSSIQVAGAASPGKAGMTGPRPGYSRQALSEKDLKARQAFMAETTDIRKQIATKSAELEAVMAQTNPDEKRAGALSGELFDLRDQLRQKAIAAGLPGGFGMGCRCGGMGPAMMGGRGMMKGRPGMMMGGPAPQNQ